MYEFKLDFDAVSKLSWQQFDALQGFLSEKYKAEKKAMNKGRARHPTHRPRRH